MGLLARVHEATGEMDHGAWRSAPCSWSGERREKTEAGRRRRRERSVEREREARKVEVTKKD